MLRADLTLAAPPFPSRPGPPPPGTLRIVALGGLGEIGMNCLALEQEEGIVLVDCGVTFPSSDLGIDVYHPRFDYLVARADSIDTLREMLDDEPLNKERLATFTFTEFLPVKRQPWTEDWFSGEP